MAGESGKEKGTLDALLGEMPRIAEAVSAFPEAVQQQVFDALMAAARGGGAGVTESGAKRTSRQPKRRKSERKQASVDGAKKPRRRPGGPSQIKELDLTPKGKTSLRDFVAEKQPKTQHDKNVVSVYYLVHELEIKEPITVDHVYTCYRDMNWPVPSNPGNSLALTASRKRYLDTSDLDNIKVAPAGLNRVEHGLPSKAKS